MESDLRRRCDKGQGNTSSEGMVDPVERVTGVFGRVSVIRDLPGFGFIEALRHILGRLLAGGPVGTGAGFFEVKQIEGCEQRAPAGFLLHAQPEVPLPTFTIPLRG